jgi:hypothetical protein
VNAGQARNVQEIHPIPAIVVHDFIGVEPAQQNPKILSVTHSLLSPAFAPQLRDAMMRVR